MDRLNKISMFPFDNTILFDHVCTSSLVNIPRRASKWKKNLWMYTLHLNHIKTFDNIGVLSFHECSRCIENAKDFRVTFNKKETTITNVIISKGNIISWTLFTGNKRGSLHIKMERIKWSNKNGNTFIKR